MTIKFSRDFSYNRHQLSHQQIDDILHESRSNEFPELKAASLLKFNNFLNITDLLGSNDIKFICLKGSVLSWRLYNDPTYRTIGDFDFLIAPGEIRKTVNVLKKKWF